MFVDLGPTHSALYYYKTSLTTVCVSVQRGVSQWGGCRDLSAADGKLNGLFYLMQPHFKDAELPL